ncbi:hypothetical protein CVT26_006908 [Gymnopilus dilepis]|uniref:Uncharacterized protein n=1 Tax=Gymnopilus dilepis TaxID=231916 RepID=A0A409W0W6_9AGAR|nr:hypothetical protein CVT26_006908 [Gymnopilus dilepis]
MAFTAIYSVLLWRGWNLYNTEQRAVVISLLTVYAVSSITFYLMLIFRFRLWMDGIRLAVLLFFQVGGTVTIALFLPSLPCTNLGSVSTCRTVENVVMFGGWSLTGLLLLFAFYLAAMSYVPLPIPRPNPEAVLALNIAAEKRMKRASSSSFGSASSVYSQTSFVGQPPTGFTGNRSNNPAVPRSLGPPRMPLNYNRPGSPGSLRSTATTSRSNIRASTREKYYNSQGLSAPQPRPPQQTQLSVMANEPFSRQGTPMSTISRNVSYTSQASNASHLHFPPGLDFPQPPRHVPPATVLPRVTSPLAARPITPATSIGFDGPPSMAAQMREALTVGTPSPVQQLDLKREVPQLSRNTSASSVPRSPSPDHQFLNNLPATPLSAILPAHPVLPPSPFRGEEQRRPDSRIRYKLYDRPVAVDLEREQNIVRPLNVRRH